MASTIVRETTEEKDDSLIIILNPDGTITVDQDTLGRLIARQHNNISIVKVGEDESPDDAEGVQDDSHINLTVEGYYPTPANPDPPTIVEDVNPGQLLSEFHSTTVRTDHRTPIHVSEVKRKNF